MFAKLNFSIYEPIAENIPQISPLRGPLPGYGTFLVDFRTLQKVIGKVNFIGFGIFQKTWVISKIWSQHASRWGDSYDQWDDSEGKEELALVPFTPLPELNLILGPPFKNLLDFQDLRKSNLDRVWTSENLFQIIKMQRRMGDMTHVVQGIASWFVEVNLWMNELGR